MTKYNSERREHRTGRVKKMTEREKLHSLVKAIIMIIAIQHKCNVN